MIDGVSHRMRKVFRPVNVKPCDVVKVLRESGAQILINYMPVGARKDTENYAQAAIDAGCAFVNCMPAFIVSREEWAKKFTDAGLICVGDDIKSAYGASFMNRNIMSDIESRGCTILSSLQKNRGSNSDFWNMQDPEQLVDKQQSKEGTVRSNVSCASGTIKVVCNGWDPAVPPDHKICNLKIYGVICNTLFTVDSELHVVDSYDSSSCVFSIIQAVAEGIRRGLSGPLFPVCAYFMKTPLKQMKDDVSRKLIEEFVADDTRTIIVSPSRVEQFTWSGNYNSEHWTSLTEGIKKEEAKAGRQVEVMSVRKHYHNGPEYVSVMRKAVEKINGYAPGYKKNLIVSFSVTEDGLKEEVIEILNSAVGVNIYGVDAPPDEKYYAAVPAIRGHIGIDEEQLGRDLFKELMSKSEEISEIRVIFHQKNNQTLNLRLKGIKEMASMSEKKVEVHAYYTFQHRQIKKDLFSGKVGIITLGNRGTEKILEIKGVETVPMVSVDNNERIKAMTQGRDLSWFNQKDLYTVEFPNAVGMEMSSQKVTA
jgi:myo-inositol-1-phosphate synthase